MALKNAALGKLDNTKESSIAGIIPPVPVY
jgi:hypothetical protein